MRGSHAAWHCWQTSPGGAWVTNASGWQTGGPAAAVSALDVSPAGIVFAAGASGVWRLFGRRYVVDQGQRDAAGRADLAVDLSQPDTVYIAMWDTAGPPADRRLRRRRRRRHLSRAGALAAPVAGPCGLALNVPVQALHAAGGSGVYTYRL
jgi:hypothetical protein